jgi:acyl-coenzyme A thioesterase PaaI-like protein
MGEHWNEPDGPFLPIGHPGVEGRERELRRLVDAVRRVLTATVTTLPPAAVTAEAAARLRVVAAELERCLPSEPLPRYVARQGDDPAPHTGAPYDIVHGIYNPLAPPLRMRFDTVDERPAAVGEITFGTPYEGPPGLVHGAVIAGCFDMVLSSANRIAGVGGPTVRLRARYRRPTRLHVPCVFQGRFDRADDGRLHTSGRLLQGDEVTVEAEGTFRELPREEIDRLAERRP